MSRGRRKNAAAAAAALAAAFFTAAVLAGCAGSPRARDEAAPAPEASASAPAAAPSDQAREVVWDEAVAVDFDKDVPKFVKKLAKAKIEEMARDKGTYFVDRALYDEAMAAYKR